MPSAGQTASTPQIVDRVNFEAQLEKLRSREKAHTHEGDDIAAARRRLPMVEVDARLSLIGREGPVTLLEAFEGRRQLVAYYFMWHSGHPAREQCEGCTWVNSQISELSYLHSRDITYAVLCQGPYEESERYYDFMGWEMPWYSAQESVEALLVGRRVGRMHVVCYLRRGDRVFETYWTTIRGVEAMDYSYALMDLTFTDVRSPGRTRPLAGHRNALTSERMAAPPIGYRCRSGPRDARVPSGPALKLDAPMTSATHRTKFRRR